MRDFQAQLSARAQARQMARSVEGMPYREAVHLIDTALDFIGIQLDEYAPDDVVETAYREYETWVAGLDANSQAVIKRLNIAVTIGLAERVKNNRRKGEEDRRFSR